MELPYKKRLNVKISLTGEVAEGGNHYKFQAH